jgi:hypothetical protein
MKAGIRSFPSEFQLRKSLFVVFGFSLSACGVGALLDADSAQFNQGGITVMAHCVAGVQTAASGCDTLADLESAAAADCSGMQMSLGKSAASGQCVSSSGAAGFSQLDYLCCPFNAGNNPAIPNGPVPANPTSPTPANPNPGSICEFIKVAPVANPQNPSAASGICGLIADMKVEAAQRCVAIGLPNMTVFNPISTPACMDPLAAGAEAICCN